jgi:ABC-type microcin C transport system duplicated ATPase subunit YejF
MNNADLHNFARAILATPPARTAPTLAEQVDRLGQIKAAQAELQTEFDRIRAELEEAGLKEIDGHQYRATFSTSTRETVNWAAIAKRLKASPQLVRAYTTTSEASTTCRVTARKTH